jgi:hypothetical protein
MRIFIGLIVAVLIIGGAFYLGSHWGAWYGAGPVATNTATTTQTDYYSDTSTWQSYADAKGGYSISYPIDFNVTTSQASSTEWRLNSNQNPGILSFTLMVPKAFEPQTNFADAKLTVGESANVKAVADCMTPDQSGTPGTLTTKPINGITFTVFTSNGAGAGNLYDTTSYRALHNNICYAVEYTVHSTQIANYPAEYNLKPFDEAKVKDVLDRIVGTFKFI